MNRSSSKVKSQLKTHLADYDYDLPPSYIAQYPVEPRDHCKLMRIERSSGAIKHEKFYDIVHHLHPNDVLVLNDTRVFPARIYGTKPTGAKIEVLLLQPTGNDEWEALVRPARRFREGDTGTFADGKLDIQVIAEGPEGIRRLILSANGEELFDILEEAGHMPLPPYIDRPDEAQDRLNYQTIYARSRGSVAAPTAGLHFTQTLLKTIHEKGIKLVPVTLHVGLGTFRPVSCQDIREHEMHSEFYTISEEGASQINAAKASGGRLIAVGTTTVRTLETASNESGSVRAGSGWTAIFIHPGYTYKSVDAIITNFHLPKSSLLMMIAAFWSLEDLLAAYRVAMENNYRFYSYGDAMVIF